MRSDRMRAVVVGAGAFGGWVALTLRRQGAAVVLVDAWGPGHARSSSGGDARIFRRSYPKAAFVRLAERAGRLWLAEQERTGRRLFEPIGLLWMAPALGEAERSVMANLDGAGVPYEWLDRGRMAAAYPQIRSDDLAGAIFEPGAGYVRAREACLAVREALVEEGGAFREAWAEPGAIRGGRIEEVALSDGTRLGADAFVFAVGPWVGGLLGEALGFSMPVTRQEVFVFGTPRGDDRFGPGRMPAWAHNGERFWYGIPGEGGLGGFKIADDTRGPAFEPTAGDRTPSGEGKARAREFLADRFPGMAEAPLIAASVCQYTEAIEGRFLADRVPGLSNAWVVAGGSGHGFKHGPAVGDYVATLVLGRAEPGSDPAFSTVAEGRAGR